MARKNKRKHARASVAETYRLRFAKLRRFVNFPAPKRWTPDKRRALDNVARFVQRAIEAGGRAVKAKPEAVRAWSLAAKARAPLGIGVIFAFGCAPGARLRAKADGSIVARGGSVETVETVNGFMFTDDDTAEGLRDALDAVDTFANAIKARSWRASMLEFVDAHAREYDGDMSVPSIATTYRLAAEHLLATGKKARPKKCAIMHGAGQSSTFSPELLPGMLVIGRSSDGDSSSRPWTFRGIRHYFIAKTRKIDNAVREYIAKAKSRLAKARKRKGEL